MPCLLLPLLRQSSHLPRRPIDQVHHRGPHPLHPLPQPRVRRLPLPRRPWPFPSFSVEHSVLALPVAASSVLLWQRVLPFVRGSLSLTF